MGEIDITDVAPPGNAVWMPGDIVGRYALMTKIATGGMAEIWLARQAGPKGFEKFVVIKKISDGLSGDPEFVEMFLDEARIAAQLSHPNIVQIYDLGEHAGAYYICMEYLAGETLSSLVRSAVKAGRPLPMVFGARIIASAAEGLSHAHHKAGVDGKPLGIVHRDVSPQNIMITYEGQVKVLDFGIAKAAKRASLTGTGQVKGKTSYMSPEQARGDGVDGRADLFALGVVLYEIVTRSRLFQFSDPLAALKAVASDEPLPAARDRNPAVPLALSEILDKALQRSPANRYLGAREFQLALEGWLKAQPDAAGSVQLSAFMSSLFRQRIEERHKLIERAAMGEVTPSAAGRALRDTETEHSMPGSSQRRMSSTPLPKGKVRWIAGGGVLAAIAALVLFLALRPPVEPPVETKVPAAPILTIETDPPGAQLAVDGRDRGPAPLTLELLGIGTHTVTASLDGYKPASRTIELGQAGEKVAVVLTLAELPPPEEPPPPMEPPPPVEPPKVVKGKLSLDTVPWTRVSLGGRDLGDTPLLEVALPEGRHTLKLVNQDKGISTTVTVEIKANQATVKKLKL